MQEFVEEPILTEKDDRFVVFPIKYDKIWKYYKEANEKFWISEQFDFSQEGGDWERLNPQEVANLSQTLAFLATLTTNLNEILVERFATEIKIAEARAFYGFQIAIMNVHLEVYSEIIELFVDKNLKNVLIDSKIANPCSIKKFTWINKYLRSRNEPFSTRIVAFACAESILMAGSFATMYFLEKSGLFLAMGLANKKIRSDKAIHWNFSCEIHNTLLDPCPTEILMEVVSGAVAVELEFISKSLCVQEIGLSFTEVKQYVQYVADELLVKLKQNKLFNVSNPFDFILNESVGLINENESMWRCVRNDEDEFKIDDNF